MKWFINSRQIFISGVSIALLVSSTTHAESLKKALGKATHGKTPLATLKEIQNESDRAAADLSQARFQKIISNPKLAQTDSDKMAALSAREYFVLVDRSESMNLFDHNPMSGKRDEKWTRWDSARLVTEAVFEVVQAMNETQKNLNVVLWNGPSRSSTDSTPRPWEESWHKAAKLIRQKVRSIQDIEGLFNANPPEGYTPLGDALEDLYQNNLQTLLEYGKPFTVVVFTDDPPADEQGVKNILKCIVKENHLTDEGREILAAFSFVRIGNGLGANEFLKNLKDPLVAGNNGVHAGLGIDIVDIKPDHFVFGTLDKLTPDESIEVKPENGFGAFALLWDAIFKWDK